MPNQLNDNDGHLPDPENIIGGEYFANHHATEDGNDTAGVPTWNNKSGSQIRTYGRTRSMSTIAVEEKSVIEMLIGLVRERPAIWRLR